MVEERVLEKWKVLIEACKAYYIDSQPTGMLDSEFDELEIRAAKEDGFYVRDYIFQTYAKGTRAQNSYIEKFKKIKVTGSMLDTMKSLELEGGVNYYYNLKYDGTSLALYLDPKTGKPLRIVTVGNLNLSSQGIDQTWKLINFVPSRFPKGIAAIQMEAVIDTTRLSEIDPQRARQKANGLINSKYCDAEINNLLTLRAYRYYCDDSIEGNKIKTTNYREVLRSFQTIISGIDGHVLFAPAEVWTLEELLTRPGYTETTMTVTRDGTFLNDGWVVYNDKGICQGALKFSGAGEESEKVKTVVQSIQWNSQLSKGKDSWSANVLIDPVIINGCTVKKPSAGSVSKLIRMNITPGAEVNVILANSTIPMIGDVYKEGNGDYQWPTCSCGYTMSGKDIFGSLLKCGNPLCSERIGRMKAYLSELLNIGDLDLNKFLVIDRMKWETTNVDYTVLFKAVENMDTETYYNHLRSFLTTDLQRRNLDLVWEASFKCLRDLYEGV